MTIHLGNGVITLQQARASAREPIRSRVQQEVERYNQTMPEIFQGLVQPERRGLSIGKFSMSVACSSFERNGFLMLANGVQILELDEPIELREDSEIQFVKLVPPVGG